MNPVIDVLVTGGGVMGLAIALELRLRGLSVTVLSRDFEQAAAHAAAGMLAPQAEELPPGPMLNLSLRSRSLYREWTRKIEELSGMPTGYWSCGILSPVYAPVESAVHPGSHWISQAAIHAMQPGLAETVVGGWWYPEDGQVDNRMLVRSLRVAAQSCGVEIHEGVLVTGIEQQQGRVFSVQTSAGEWQASHYILATGAWSAELIPVPVTPRKGQMLSLALPPGHTGGMPLKQVLHGSEVYLVPRRDGRIIVGATSESVGFAPGNTPAGIHRLLDATLRLFPSLKDLPIQECWWGFRPATPDGLPLLGVSLWDNLILATGHYRNGILLAPATAQLIADLVAHNQPDPLLTHFSWTRFLNSSSACTGATASPAERPTATHPPIHPSTPSPSMLSTPAAPTIETSADTLIIAGRTFRSRLMTGTGKFANFDLMRQSIEASGSEIVTVAVRRVQTNAPGHQGLGEALDWSKLWMLPNTAGCQTAEDAVRVARLGREMAKLLGQEDNNFVKLEVIPDSHYLLPDPIGTLQAAEQLVQEGFDVLPYINADPLLAKRLEEVGCVTVMPLGSPIGSGQGIKNAANIQIIIENATVPVVVDAGIGAPSEAAQAMEMGASALLINTAIAQAKDPILMGKAMGMATDAGRAAFLAGRIPIKAYASASSPLTGSITSRRGD